MDKLLSELMDEYKERFDDIFPLMMTGGWSDKRIYAEIRRCLEEGHKFDPDLPDGARV